MECFFLLCVNAEYHEDRQLKIDALNRSEQRYSVELAEKGHTLDEIKELCHQKFNKLFEALSCGV